MPLTSWVVFAKLVTPSAGPPYHRVFLKVTNCSAPEHGFVMAGTYNTRPMPAEILVKGGNLLLFANAKRSKNIGESTLPGRNRYRRKRHLYFEAVFVGLLVWPQTLFRYQLPRAPVVPATAANLGAFLAVASAD